MAITDITVEGGGLRITNSDGTIDQFTFDFANGTFRLLKNGSPPPSSVVRDIIDTIEYDGLGSVLYAHLFGTAADHISATAIEQIDDALTADTWETIIWDNVQLESHNGLGINTVNGAISLPFGEWDIDARIQLYDTSGASSSAIAIDIFDVDNGQELPSSFATSSVVAKVNGPKSITCSTQIDLTDLESGDLRRITVRAQSNQSTTKFGVHSSFLPAGSENHAGLLRVSRIG